MNLAAISHRAAFTDCYPVSENELVIRIRTGKDITAVNIIQEDPYIAGISNSHPWSGERLCMERIELEHNLLWSVRLSPKYRRVQYYFEIFAGEEKIYLLEDRLYIEEQWNTLGRIKQYFKYPWMNEADRFCPPQWVKDTVWYQIMPDRFCRSGALEHGRKKLRDWNDTGKISYDDFFGGTIGGITEKLGYLKDLGISGIYLTPIWQSDTYHKYNISDYTKIDEDFGTEEDVKELIRTAHSMGIRVMVDAVFNHCGTGFFAWKDVVERGSESEYFDWFFIREQNFHTDDYKTRDGRYFSFAFEAGMPKLNTAHPAVAGYLTGLSRHWVQEWEVDGIRFDVGNEIAHSFVKQLRHELKSINPEIFLLGEIWHDSVQWLLGDEYDSVMDYPFLESVHDFWVDTWKTSYDFMYSMNRCFSMYVEQVNEVLFHFLDSHDVMRAYTRCGEDLDVFFQQLVILMTMPGSPCLYYGTEIAMPGGNDPDNRRTMPWDQIAEGAYDSIRSEVGELLRLHKRYCGMGDRRLEWRHHSEYGRLLHYVWRSQETGVRMEVYLNAGQEEAPVQVDGTVIYGRKYGDDGIKPGGILITERTVERVNQSFAII